MSVIKERRERQKRERAQGQDGEPEVEQKKDETSEKSDDVSQEKAASVSETKPKEEKPARGSTQSVQEPKKVKIEGPRKDQPSKVKITLGKKTNTTNNNPADKKKPVDEKYRKMLQNVSFLTYSPSFRSSYLPPSSPFCFLRILISPEQADLGLAQRLV